MRDKVTVCDDGVVPEEVAECVFEGVCLLGNLRDGVSSGVVGTKYDGASESLSLSE